MEPARKQTQDTEPDFRPDLRSIPGGGETTPERSRDHLRVLENPEQEKTGRHLRALENSPEENNKDDSVKDREESGGGIASTIKNSYTGGASKSKIKGTFNWRKNGTITGIVVGLLGGVGLLTTLFTPGLGLVHMKEVLTGDLNDQLAAMDIRSDYMFRAKLDSISSGVCTGVQIRCKFSTMSKRQVAKFQSALTKSGFSIPDGGIEDRNFGRQRITSITAPDGRVITNPAEFANLRKTNPEVRSIMNRVYNPLYYGLSDKVANTFFKNNNTNKQRKIKGGTDEERRASVAQATSGERAGGRALLVAADGREYVVKDDGTPMFRDENPAEFDRIKNEIDTKTGQLNDRSSPGGKAMGSVLTGAARGLSVLGAAQSACTVYNVANAVVAASKVARSMQLIQYAMVVNSEIDAIKAGQGSVEGVEFVGNMFTATDNRKMVPDDITGEMIDNPFYGKSGFDSPGYKTAAFNDAPNLTVRSQQYMVGGGLSGTLSTTIDDIESAIGVGGDRSVIRDRCGVLLSPWVVGIGLIGGVALAVGSAGIGTAISIGASAIIAIAIPFLEAALADIIAGNVIGENIGGVDAGDAYFAGTGAMLGGIAMNRGMTPLSKEGIQSYLAATSESRDSMIAAEKHEAQKTPFDVSNQYSFIGSFARSLYPISVTAKSGLNGALLSTGQVLSKGFSSLLQPVSATTEYNEARFSKCNDPGFEELGINADIFCNVRYGLTIEELSMDPIQVVDYMLFKEHITDSGEPKSEDFKNFTDNCVNRKDGWGETSEEGGSIGKECMDNSEFEDISYFRTYTLDKSINDGMDDELVQEEGTSVATGRPDGAIDSGKGWALASGVDYSQYPCDPRTEEFMDRYTTVYGATIRLCIIKSPFSSTNSTNGSFSVASVVSTNAMNLFEDAIAAGHKIGLADGMRLNFSGGYISQHPSGTAMDIRVQMPSGGVPTICFQGANTVTGWGTKENAERICRERFGGPQYEAYKWLTENAANYGFYNFDPEPWHWSTNGL